MAPATEFTRLVPHLPAVRAFLTSKERDPDVRADVEAQLLEAAPGLLQNVRDAASLRSFVVGIAANLLRRHHHARRREVEVLEKLAYVPVSPVDDPESVAGRRQELDQVLSALGELPVAQRDALMLTAVEGASLHTAASMAGVAESTFRSRVFWARKNIEAALGRASPARRTRASAIFVAALILVSMVAFGAWRAMARRGVAPMRSSTRSVVTPFEPTEFPRSPELSTPPLVAAVVPRPAKRPQLMAPTAVVQVAPVVTPAPPHVAAVVPRPAMRPELVAPTAATVAPEVAAEVPDAVRVDLAAYERALTLQLAGKNDEAIAAWTVFLKTAPAGVYQLEARFRRALAWARQGNWSLARPELAALAVQTQQPGIASDAAELLTHAE